MKQTFRRIFAPGCISLCATLMQAGEGIPQAGISIPNTAAGLSAVNRPGTAIVFPNTYTVLPPVMPGSQLGTVVTTTNATTGATLAGGFNTDIINILYEDNTLVSSAGGAAAPALNGAPVTQAAPSVPVCAGAISATGLTVTLAPACFTLPGGVTPITVGDLIMFQNANGTALEYVTGIAGQTLTFAAGDPAGLNQTGLPNGTITDLAVGATPTTISRVWLITYYVDAVTIPTRPQLVRQVNYPNFPVAAPAYPPQSIAEVIENLTFSYDITNSSAAVGAYGVAGAGNAPTTILPDTPFNIRAVNASLGGRSEYVYNATSPAQYLRNSLSTQVAIRSMSFTNGFNTSTTAP